MMTDNTNCNGPGCVRPLPDHVKRKGGRFCSTPCRAAFHREIGKAVPASVQSVSRYSDGAACVVIRVPVEFLSKVWAIPTGEPVDLIRRD